MVKKKKENLKLGELISMLIDAKTAEDLTRVIAIQKGLEIEVSYYKKIIKKIEDRINKIFYGKK